jgi:hypothetical protein
LELTNEAHNEKERSTSASDLSLFYGNWIWRAVHCLIDCPDFNPSPKWSASRLNIGVEKIVDAFEGLERLNLIKRENNTFKLTNDWTQVTPKDADPTDLLKAHSRLSAQITSKLTPEDKFTVQFFRGNKELVSKYSPKFIQLYKEMNDEAEAKGLKDVVASEISFAILSSQENGGVQ